MTMNFVEMEVVASEAPLLAAKEITKDFFGVEALSKVSFELMSGEVLGVVGESGAGKSLLAGIVSGGLRPSSGGVEVKGNPVVLPDIGAARKLGIVSVPQKCLLAEDLEVFENVFLGAELRRGPLLDVQSMKNRTQKLLELLNADISPSDRVRKLNRSQKQLVAVAKAISATPRVLILDETDAVLNPREAEMLFSLIRELKGRGVGIIYTSRDLRNARKHCDRIAMLRDGALIATERTWGMNDGRIAENLPKRSSPQFLLPQAVPQKEVILDVRGLHVENALNGVSFSLRKGEVLGIVGTAGSGCAQLGETLAGFRRKSAGSIRVGAERIDIRTPRQALDRGVSYLPSGRRSLFTDLSAAQNITMASLPQYSPLFFIEKEKEYLSAARYVEEFGIRAPSLGVPLKLLGNDDRRKIALAGRLNGSPQILVMDDPTRGMSIESRREFHFFIKDRVLRGLSCIFISPDLKEIASVSHRVAVLSSGKIVAVLEGPDLNEKKIKFFLAKEECRRATSPV